MLSGERDIHDRLHFYLLYVFLTISLCFRGVKECHPLGPFWLDTAGGRLDIEKARKLGSLVITWRLPTSISFLSQSPAVGCL